MIKIILIAIVSGTICLYLKSINSEYFALSLIASGILLLFETISYLTTTFEFISELIELSNIDSEIIKIILKITLIGVLIEFTASLLNDFGFNSLALKITFLGKIIILSVSIPIFYSVFNIIKNLLEI